LQPSTTAAAPVSVVAKLERYFEFAALATNWRTEILAGFTTFITMAYIVVVNPAILHEAGMPLAAVTAATCLSAAIGSILMGVLARYPIALAPGMGLNAYFTYSVVVGLHVPWQVALGAVFISGVVFVLLTVTGLRQKILRSIPHQLYPAVAGGIGLFIALIGLKNAGIIVANSSTMISLGNVRSPETALALFGVLLVAALQVWQVRGGMLIGIVGTALSGWTLGLVHWHPEPYNLSAITATAFKLDLRGAFRFGILEIIFVFLFVDLFDNLGTLVAVTKKAGLIREDHEIPRVDRILLADATATICGSLAGTSTVTSYVESAAGVAAGGRSGFAAITTGILFLVALFLAPFLGVLPPAATAPALIVVGSLMLSTISEIHWNDPLVAFPAFLTLIMIPLTYSIASGLGFGMIAYACLRLIRGQVSREDWLLYVLAALFLLRFVFMAKS
jgi:AGZA family xanthine/uracil permease-like MFS transporter